MTNGPNLNWITSYTWGIADDALDRCSSPPSVPFRTPTLR